jgi:molybdenum cofactor cytidylyltransferase
LRVASLVLAAGASSRMGRPKPLLPWGTTTMLGEVLATARSSAASPPWVVTGDAAEAVAAEAQLHCAATVHNPQWQSAGLTGSLQVGLRALPAQVDGVFVWLADQPLVAAGTAGAMLAAFAATRPAAVVPEHAGRWGHPVLFGRVLFAELLALAPSEPPRTVLRRAGDRVLVLAVTDPGVLVDLDTTADYELWRPR